MNGGHMVRWTNMAYLALLNARSSIHSLRRAPLYSIRRFTYQFKWNNQASKSPTMRLTHLICLLRLSEIERPGPPTAKKLSKGR